MSTEPNDPPYVESGNDTPWDDPNVKAALKSGRPPSDIMLIDCPECGEASYYNQGSHFTCRACDCGWAVISDDEDPPDRAYIMVDEAYSLDEWDSFEPPDVP